MMSWFDSRWMRRFAGVPPTLSGRTAGQQQLAEFLAKQRLVFEAGDAGTDN